MKKKRWKAWIAIVLLLLAAALFLALFNVYDSWRAGEDARQVQSSLEGQMPGQGDGEESGDSETEADDEISHLLEDREMPTVEVDGNRYIGYLEFPSLHRKLPVMDEWDYDKLKTAPCRYSGSVYKNNLVIAGHNYISHFGPVRYQKIGTEVDFIDADGVKYTYEISDIEVLDPYDINDMTQTDGGWDLTLFTCTTGGKARYAIRCTRTDMAGQ